MNSFELLWHYREAFTRGLVTTSELLLISAVVGTVFAATIELVCHAKSSTIRRVADDLALFVSAVPALVVLFWLYYPAQALLDVVVSPFWTAAFALTFINTFAVYRIIADALKDFPRQYVAAGKVCGLTDKQVIRYVQVPLLVRAAFPRWLDQQIVILQTSLFASLISVEEIFRVAQRINSQVYRPVTIYTSMAILFLITAGAALYYARHLRRKSFRDFSER